MKRLPNEGRELFRRGFVAVKKPYLIQQILAQLRVLRGWGQILRTRDQRRQLSVELFGDLPKQGERRMLPPRLNVYDRRAADPQPASKGSLAHLGRLTLTRCTNSVTHGRIEGIGLW